MKKTCKSIIDCPNEKQLFMNKKGYEIFECITCGHRFHPLNDSEMHLDKVYSTITTHLFFLKQHIIKLLTNSLGKLKLIYAPIVVKWYMFQKRH